MVVVVLSNEQARALRGYLADLVGDFVAKDTPSIVIAGAYAAVVRAQNVAKKAAAQVRREEGPF